MWHWKSVTLPIFKIPFSAMATPRPARFLRHHSPVGQQHTGVVDDAAHDGFAQVIGKIVFSSACRSRFPWRDSGYQRHRNNLLHGNSQRVAGVEKAKSAVRPKRPLIFFSSWVMTAPLSSRCRVPIHRDDWCRGEDKLRWEWGDCAWCSPVPKCPFVQFGQRGR